MQTEYTHTFDTIARLVGSANRQIVLAEMLAFLVLYGVVSVTYRIANPYVKDRLEGFFIFCRNFQGLIPLAFILGFYVTQVWRLCVCLELCVLLRSLT